MTISQQQERVHMQTSVMSTGKTLGMSLIIGRLYVSCFQNTSESLEHPDECDDSSRPSSPSDASFVSQHALRQAELGRQLQELTKALAMKEELANKMVANDSRLTSMRKQYEVGNKNFVHGIYIFCACLYLTLTHPVK